MKVLVYGAGVLGTLFAARLRQAGADAAILARGRRLMDIRTQGLVLEELIKGCQTRTRIPAVERLGPDDRYDWVLVLVRKNQVASVLPDLAAHAHSPSVLFLHNNAAGPAELVAALGRERVLLGFPGAGGTRQEHVVRFGLIPQQPTTLGELDGSITPRLRRIAALLQRAALPVRLSRRMDAWLKTHAAFVTAVAGALYGCGTDPARLAREPEGVPNLVRAVREGFAALRLIGVPVTPLKLKILFEWLPLAAPVAYWRRYLCSPAGEDFFAGHTRVAADEMKLLANEFRQLKRAAPVVTPALDRLYGFIDHAVLTGPTAGGS